MQFHQLAAPQPTHLALELAVKCLPVDGRHPAQLGAVRSLEVTKLHAVRSAVPYAISSLVATPLSHYRGRGQ